MKRPVHVMVAILRDHAGRVLITSRPPGKTQAGRWEFPGGKLEPSESPEAGLRRELLEELGVVAGPMQRLIVVEHEYPDFLVRLDVREIEHFGGEPRPRERQQLAWADTEDLDRIDILEADRPIIQALRLPDTCLVTPGLADQSHAGFLRGLDASLAAGIRLVQLRLPGMNEADYLALAREANARCQAYGARLVLNALPELLGQVPADGIHLGSARLMRTHRRPVPETVLLSAACHDASQVAQARRIGADFILVSPVAGTPTHAKAAPLGWAGLAAIAARCSLPVYALGGMTPEDVPRARACGARGVAGIRGFWRGT